MTAKKKTKYYKPLEVKLLNMTGLIESLQAMRLPKDTVSDSRYSKNSRYGIASSNDLRLARALVLAGTDHAKFSRGICAYLEMKMQVGFMIDFETYRIGVECLSTSSTMHGELKHLTGVELAEEKQKLMATKVYTRIVKISYQALRAIYFARRNHRHPDFGILCRFIESLPYADSLITCEKKKQSDSDGCHCETSCSARAGLSLEFKDALMTAIRNKSSDNLSVAYKARLEIEKLLGLESHG